MVKPSDALILIAMTLKTAVSDASQPGDWNVIAEREAVRLAHLLAREWEACNWRADLQKSLEMKPGVNQQLRMAALLRR